MQALTRDTTFSHVLARFAAPNWARSASSIPICAHPARRAFCFIGRSFL